MKSLSNLIELVVCTCLHLVLHAPLPLQNQHLCQLKKKQQPVSKLFSREVLCHTTSIGSTMTSG